MQITGGKFRGLRLRSLPSEQVRPTARRVRERLFELLGERIEGASFVDLCAGSGAVGLEALSRGAGHATFVDRSPRACVFVRVNLLTCNIPAAQSRVVVSPAHKFLRETAERADAAWDIAYFDPPYAIDYAPVIKLFATTSLLNPRGMLVAEHNCQRQPEVEDGLDYLGTTELGETCLSFFERKT
jgi:16S rRNA (guanine966-N2)-methyltransferase